MTMSRYISIYWPDYAAIDDLLISRSDFAIYHLDMFAAAKCLYERHYLYASPRRLLTYFDAD